MIWVHSKQDDSIISSEMSIDALAIHKMISSSDRFFWRSATLKSWIPSAASSSSITQGALWVRELKVNLRGINAKLVFLLRILSSHFQSRELQRCHKQAGGCIFPGHLIADTELPILVCSSSNFLAIIML